MSACLAQASSPPCRKPESDESGGRTSRLSTLRDAREAFDRPDGDGGRCGRVLDPLSSSQAWLRDMLRLLRIAALALPALALGDRGYARDIGVCMVGQLRGGPPLGQEHVP